MGEAKRREAADAVIAALSKTAADRGELIELGWLALRAVWLHPYSPPNQVQQARWAFFAGAQHLYASIMAVMDEDREPTDADLRKMELIAAELERFGQDVNASLPVEGRA